MDVKTSTAHVAHETIAVEMREAVDLNACDREPIHIPGSIQPHGMILVTDTDGFHVRYVAGNIERNLGVAAWKGAPLDMLIGKALSAKAAALIEPETTGGYIRRAQTPSGENLDVSAYFSPPYLVVELEAASATETSMSLVLDGLAAADGFERAVSLSMLCQKAAVEFRRLTGFDRVMVYRFLDDGVGRVLAEDRREGLRSFLNQHFPASDIPVQARALYLRNLIQVI